MKRKKRGTTTNRDLLEKKAKENEKKRASESEREKQRETHARVRSSSETVKECEWNLRKG